MLLYLAQEGRNIGLVNKLRAYTLQDRGLDTLDANRALGWGADERNFLIAATMLEALGMHAHPVADQQSRQAGGAGRLRRGGRRPGSACLRAEWRERPLPGDQGGALRPPAGLRAVQAHRSSRRTAGVGRAGVPRRTRARRCARATSGRATAPRRPACCRCAACSTAPTGCGAPECAVPVEPIAPTDGWCDDPSHGDYNRMVRLPHEGQLRGTMAAGRPVRPGRGAGLERRAGAARPRIGDLPACGPARLWADRRLHRTGPGRSAAGAGCGLVRADGAAG